AHTLADVLGGNRVTRSVADVATVDGLTIDWLRISDSWPSSGSTLEALRLPERVGVVVVAVIRDGETLPSPRSGLELHVEDTVVVVGTAEAVTAAGQLLRGD
ncbi:MAG: cation:proton antiporter regulatory subunit, partial [Longimicrobiales bacterium]